MVLCFRIHRSSGEALRGRSQLSAAAKPGPKDRWVDGFGARMAFDCLSPPMYANVMYILYYEEMIGFFCPMYDHDQASILGVSYVQTKS